MADEFLTAPEMDRLIRTAAMNGRMPGSGTPGAMSMNGGHPLLQEWWKGAQQRLFGQELPSPGIDPFRRQVLDSMLRVAEFPTPEYDIPVPDTWAQGQRPSVPWDPGMLFKSGFKGATLGALASWLSFTMNEETDPSYDPFSDRRILESPWRRNWEYFEGSKSAKHTEWILSRLEEQQKEGDRINRMNGPTAPIQFIGGMMGDPLNFIPIMGASKAAYLASKGVSMSALEKAAFGFRHVALGSLADGVMMAGQQAALALASNAIQAGLDPTHHVESYMDVLAVPVALGASIGTIAGGLRRFSEAANVLSRSRMGDPDFLKPVPPAGRAAPDGSDLPHGPLGVDPATNVPAGRFPGWNPVDNDVESAINSAVKAGDLDLAEQLRKVSKMDPRDRALSLGALATMYEDMRLLEAERQGDVSLRHRPDFDEFVSRNGIPGSKGKPLMVFHATNSTFVRFADEKLGGNTGANSAMEGHFFAGRPDTAEGYAPYLEQGDGKIVKNSFIQRLLGKGSYRVEGENISRGDGAQIRPTYIRMENPYFIGRDAAPPTPVVLGSDPSIIMPGIPIKDVDGVTWVQVETKGANGKPFFHYVEQGGTGRTAKEITTTGGGTFNFVEELKKAKAAGHDGAIVENWTDGEFHKPDTIYVVFDTKNIKNFDERWDVNSHPGGGGGDLSAARSPGSMVTNRAALLQHGRMAPTGIGIEKLPFDIVSRAAASPFTSWQSIAQELLSTGGRLTVGNKYDIANVIPVEVEIKQRWMNPLITSIRVQHDEWRAYREALAGNAGPLADKTDFGRLAYEARTRLSDKLSSKNATSALSFEEFRRRVGDAQNNLDNDPIADAASLHVNKVAKELRKHYDDLRDEAQSVGLFKAAYERQIQKMSDQIERLKREGARDEVIRGAMASHLAAEEKLKQLIQHGPSVSLTAPSFRPRMWLVDQLVEREADFKQIVKDFYRKKNYSVAQADAIADRVHSILIGDKPFWERNNFDQLIEKALDPQSAMARTFEIPDHLVKDFLENDSEVLLRHHSRQMGTAIEMTRRFGSTDMADQVREIQQEARTLMHFKPAEERVKIRKARDAAIEDLLAARDRLYGVYGADAHPHSLGNRSIRIAKQFSNVTLLGMAGITALGDLVRPAMTEGLQAMHHYGFKTLFSEARAEILRMSLREINLSGDGFEFLNNVRAVSASDVGDVLHSRTRFERGLNQFNQNFFILNGLNAVNQIDKQWAGVIIQGLMNDNVMEFIHGGKIAANDLAKYAAAGIDTEMLRRIGNEVRAHGKSFKSIMMANTDDWTDDLARKHYHAALYQMINRTVPTPGIGDTPNVFSTPMGSLMAQYKSFAFGAMNRTLIAGLQEGGARFWYGAALSVGFAVILNELRSRFFYDRSTFDRPMTGVIADAVDRSGIVGYFSDANRAVESLTGNRLGVKPVADWMLGNKPSQPSPPERRIGTMLGPSAGQAATGVSVLNDFFSGHPTAKTWADARRLVPGGTLPYLDPIYDRMISDGRWHPKKGQAERLADRRKVNRHPEG